MKSSKVKDFYSEIQFNTGDERIQSLNENLSLTQDIPSKTLQTLLDIEMFMDIESVTSVLELGCGNGWLSNRISKHYPLIDVTAIDIVESNIEYAKYSETDANFLVEDILETKRTGDLVVSIGALHHIPNISMPDAINKALTCADRFAFIGLYHKESRDAMFNWFKQYPEEEWYDIFTELTPNYVDETQRQSWFEDQFYAPYEQTVTFADLHQSCKLSGSKIISTSIEDGIDFKQRTVDKLNNKEFTSGFIYTLFDKNPMRNMDEELLKQRIDDIRTNDPYIYR